MILRSSSTILRNSSIPSFDMRNLIRAAARFFFSPNRANTREIAWAIGSSSSSGKNSSNSLACCGTAPNPPPTYSSNPRRSLPFSKRLSMDFRRLWRGDLLRTPRHCRGIRRLELYSEVTPRARGIDELMPDDAAYGGAASGHRAGDATVAALLRHSRRRHQPRRRPRPYRMLRPARHVCRLGLSI